MLLSGEPKARITKIQKSLEAPFSKLTHLLQSMIWSRPNLCCAEDFRLAGQSKPSCDLHESAEDPLWEGQQRRTEVRKLLFQCQFFSVPLRLFFVLLKTLSADEHWHLAWLFSFLRESYALALSITRRAAGVVFPAIVHFGQR